MKLKWLAGKLRTWLACERACVRACLPAGVRVVEIKLQADDGRAESGLSSILVHLLFSHTVNTFPTGYKLIFSCC